MKVGRHTKLTPPVHDAIVESVRTGNYYETAARAAGISDRSLFHWLERGEADIEAGEDTVFAQFFLALTRARGEAEARAVKVLADAAPEDWRAAAHFLERAFPKSWGRRDRHEVSGPDGGPIPLADAERLLDQSLSNG